MSGVDLSMLEDHHEQWTLTNSSGDVKSLGSGPEFHVIFKTLDLSRRSTYYVCLYVGPAVLLALLTPFIFLLPHEDTHKLSLGTTHTHARTHTRTHTHKHTLTHTHTYARTHTQTHKQTYKHTHEHTHKHTQTRKHTLTHTHTRTHARTHTHT